MKTHLAIFCLLSFSQQICIAQQDKSYSLQSFLDSAEKQLNFHGTVLLIQDVDTILYKGYGYGDIKNKVPTEKTTAYYIGSIAKTFTAIGIMKLVEEGKISLQDPLHKYFSNVPTDKAGITIHQLLVHQSGMGQHYVADNQETQEKALNKIFKLPLDEAPGKKFIYSNENYTLLGIITERVTNTTWEDYIRKTILEPLDMNRTFFFSEYSFIPYAKALQTNGKKATWVKREYGNIGAAGIFSTPVDMAKFENAVKTSKILTGKTLEDLLRPRIKVKSSQEGVSMSYAYVMFVNQTGQEPLKAVWFRGNADRWGTAVSYWFPGSNTTLIVFSNKELLSNKEKSHIYISDELIKRMGLF
jgi:CubicO group peptidase (beta-lactamase class C family)